MRLRVLIGSALFALLMGASHGNTLHLTSKGQGASPSGGAPPRPDFERGNASPALQSSLKIALATLVIPGGWDENPSDNSETAFSRTVSQHLHELLTGNAILNAKVVAQLEGRDARPLLWPPFFSGDKRPELQAALCERSGADIVLGVLAPDNPGGRGRRTGDYSFMRCSDQHLHRETIWMQRDFKKDTFGYQSAFTEIVTDFLIRHQAAF